MTINKYCIALAVSLATNWGALTATPANADDKHDAKTETKDTAKTAFAGDPYLLPVDPASDEKLPDVPLVYQHEGRELRFANKANLDAFKADPSKYIPKVDQKIVQQQMPFYSLTTCPVTGEKLGGDMGEPVDFIYKNRLIRFCCSGCVKNFIKDPAKYISVLNEAVRKAQAAIYPMTTCMVSGDKLGGDMGKPVEKVVAGRLVKLCCAGCVAEFDKNPAKYLAMLDAATEKQAGAASQAKPTPEKSATPKDHKSHQH